MDGIGDRSPASTRGEIPPWSPHSHLDSNHGVQCQGEAEKCCRGKWNRQNTITSI